MKSSAINGLNIALALALALAPALALTLALAGAVPASASSLYQELTCFKDGKATKATSPYFKVDHMADESGADFRHVNVGNTSFEVQRNVGIKFGSTGKIEVNHITYNNSGEDPSQPYLYVSLDLTSSKPAKDGGVQIKGESFFRQANAAPESVAKVPVVCILKE